MPYDAPVSTDPTLDRLFVTGRTFSVWEPKPVEPQLLERLYELVRTGPTGNNSQPARFVFVTSHAAKERLRPALFPGNVDKTMSAPVTVIVAYDSRFHEKMPQLVPARPELSTILGNLQDEAKQHILLQNASLEAGYLILAARALGLDAGPMGGFDRAKVDEALLAETTWKSSLLVNLGYGDRSKLQPRNPRLAFEEAAAII